MECKIRTPVVSLALALVLAGCGRPQGEAQYRAGLKSLARGRAEQSIEAFERSIQHSADSNRNPLAYNYLGVAFYRAGRMDKALAAFEASRKLAPLLPDPVYNTAVLMAEQNQDSKAISLFEKAGLMDLEDSRPYEYLSMLYCRRQQWSEAQRVLEEADRRSPQSPRILTAMAVLELQTNSAQKAADILMEALERDKQYAPAIFNLAVLNHFWLKNNDQAIAYYKDFIRLTSDTKLADRARQALLELKKAAGSAAKPAPAQATHAIQIQPAPEWRADERRPSARPEPENPGYGDLIEKAKIKLDSGQAEEALALFLLAEDVATREGVADDAEAAMKMAAGACPDSATARHSLAKRMLERRRTADALAQIKMAVAQSNTWTEARLMLAETAILESDFEAALESLNALTGLNTGNADAQWLLAAVYDRHLKEAEKALEAYKQFCRKFPSDPRSEGAKGRIAALSAAASRNRQQEADLTPAGAPPRDAKPESKKPATRKRQFVSPRRIIGER